MVTIELNTIASTREVRALAIWYAKMWKLARIHEENGGVDNRDTPFCTETITSHYLLRTVWYTFINYDSANGISRIGARMPLSLIHSSCFCIDWRGMADRRVQPRLRDNLKVMHECKDVFWGKHKRNRNVDASFGVGIIHLDWIPLLQSPLMQEARQSRRSPERARGLRGRGQICPQSG